MKKTLFSIVALLMTVTLLFCGCAELQPNPATAPKVNLYDSGYISGDAITVVFGETLKHSQLPIIQINTADELAAFSQSAKEHCFTIENEGEKVELPQYSTYDDAVSAYTAEFFADKTLVVCYAYTTQSPAVFEVSNISIEGNTLTVMVDTLEMGVDASMEGRFIFIELSKQDMKNVTELVVIRDVGELV